VRRLGVNIDHIATLRNARGELHPDPIFAAKFVKKAGADSITIHLREDRRHIKDNDAKKICSLKKILVNLEISTNPKMISKALKIKPNYICLVPENRKEVTTEGGLDLNKNKNKSKKNNKEDNPNLMASYDWRAELDEDWQKVNRQDKTDGLSRKAVKAYRRENPGSKLQTAVTKDPKKLKKGSKSAKRRLSFCRRMKGMKKKLTSAKTRRDPDSRINKALRRWNC